jgi:hypothetical protein
MIHGKDAPGELEGALRGPDPRAVPQEPPDAFERASREIKTRWAQLARLIAGDRTRGRGALVAGHRARSAA